MTRQIRMKFHQLEKCEDCRHYTPNKVDLLHRGGSVLLLAAIENDRGGAWAGFCDEEGLPHDTYAWSWCPKWQRKKKESATK